MLSHSARVNHHDVPLGPLAKIRWELAIFPAARPVTISSSVSGVYPGFTIWVSALILIISVKDHEAVGKEHGDDICWGGEDIQRRDHR